MISKTDIEIYSEIFQEKSITEKYLGYASFNWEYSSIKYNADCTLAIPFDLFDKVIVEILSVDDVLSIEQIGEILGMNLIHKPENQQYKDEAEYDILRIALDNLKDYNMIEIGDTSYSSCKLTRDGKLFAAKGYKFRVEENKPFIIFFDHTSSNHQQAKKEFETIKGKQVQINSEFDFLDETLLQSIAEIQVPEIHNPKLGNSFINSRIDFKNSSSFNLNISVSLLFDIETKQSRFVAVEPISKKVNQYFTDFLNKNKQEFLNLFEQDIKEGTLVDSENSYLEKLIQDKQKIQNLISTKPQDALIASKKANAESDFVDQEYFWLNLNEFVSNETEELFLLIPEPTDFSISKINQLAEQKETPSLFVVFQHSTDETVNSKIKQLHQFSTKTDNKLFVSVYREVNSFECLIRNKKGIYTLTEIPLEFKNAEIHFSKVFYKKEFGNQNELPIQYVEIKKTFADDYLKYIENDIDEISENEIENELVNKKFILEQFNIGKKANVFLTTELNSESKKSLHGIIKDIEKHISGLKNRHQLFLIDKLSEFTKRFEENNKEKLEDIVQLQNSVTDLEADFFDDYSGIKATSKVLKENLTIEIKRIKDEILAKTYIIDTNVFIKEPDIISKIDPKHYVALSLTVIEELDKLKTIAETKANAVKAIININSALKKSSNAKFSRVRKARADLTLLPDELQKKTADNLLLSLGIVYKKNNPVLLTLDRNFQSKAMMLEIPLITIYELLGIKAEVKPKPITKTQDEYLKMFKSMKPDKNGDYLINDFIFLVRKQNPSFDYKKLGFENVFKFVLSLRLFKVYKSKFIKLK